MDGARLRDHYDAIVIGARPAGAGTALRLAQQGLDVLVVERGRYGSDTLSTHALMRAGVLLLTRWGVLPRIIAAGTPPVRAVTFMYGDEPLDVAVKPRDGVEALYAPRRTVLDRAIADEAVAAGVEVAFSTALVDVLRTRGDRVCGIIARQAGRGDVRVRANLVVGADGMRSSLASVLDAAVVRRARSSSANVFGYWADLPVAGYRWYYRPGVSAGAIPTNDGLTCVFASVPTSRFADVFGGDVARGYHDVVAEAAPDLADAMRRSRTRAVRLRGAPGEPGFFRRATGPGWALVGDAGYFKDPLTAHGITDALVEAEYLARAISKGTDSALAEYDDDRVQRTRELFEVTQRIASFEWTLNEVHVLHKQLARAMADEVTALNEIVSPVDQYSFGAT